MPTAWNIIGRLQGVRDVRLLMRLLGGGWHKSRTEGNTVRLLALWTDRGDLVRDVLLIDMAGWGMIYCAAKALGIL